MNEIDAFYKDLPQGRCKGCKYSKAVVATGQYMFLGCYHSPYFGKWVAEIKDCPRRIDIEIARGGGRMTVIVKGMDMPQDCFECDFQNPFVEEPYCRRLLKRCPKTSRLEDCPLGEVLTPHGRLIDMDETLHTFSELEPYRKAFEAIVLLEAEE